MQLRPYQLAALDAIFDYFETEGGCPLVEMATGTGKSLVMAEICRKVVRKYDKKVVVVTHVRELIEQNHDELRAIWPLAPAGVHSSGLNQWDTRQQIIFAGIQTAHRNAAQFGHVDLLLVDEAHLIPRKANTMYGRFIAELHAVNPDMRVAGLTATPFRLGSGRLDQGDGAMFNKLVFEYGIADGVRDGYLARLVSKATETGFDLTGVGKSGGEYVEKQLQAAVDKEETTRRAVTEAVEYGKQRNSWLAFCSGIAHSFHVRDEIRRRGFTAETVTGETPSEERRQILEDFKVGHIRCVTNNSVLTTGFNAPGVDMIMALRPTASASLYVQMMGRGTRVADGKDNCLVLDFAGLIRTHGPVDQVRAPNASTGSGVAPIKECPKCHSLIHASLRECPDCNHIFPPSTETKLTARASSMAIMASAEPEWLRVSAREFKLNYRPGDTSLVQANFKCGQVTHRAWFMPEYGKRNKADRFWLEHGGRLPCPRSAGAWLLREDELRPTAEIEVRPGPKGRIKVTESRAVEMVAA